MREIKFRGVTPTKCWITGSLIYHGEEPRIEFVKKYHPVDNRILATDWCYVDPKTVGQFTGLKDKNGKEVYEGDIMDNGDGGRCYVVYDTEQAAFGYTYYPAQIRDVHLFSPFKLSYMEVIGNIYDNPVIAK